MVRRGCRRGSSANAQDPRSGWWSPSSPGGRPTFEPAPLASHDQDAQHRYHLLPHADGGPKLAFKEPSLAELARGVEAGACIEARFNEARAKSHG